MDYKITARYVDVEAEKIYPAELIVKSGKVFSIQKVLVKQASELPFLTPGFVDAHVHIESSMLVPAEFARLAVVHGTVATVSDPHEITNVCGIAGIEFMLENASTIPFKFNFGAPSCVPATIFETAGAGLNAKEVADLLSRRDIKYLSEMMNFPGVLNNDTEVKAKIEAAKRYHKPVDGHAPGLRGAEVAAYIAAGISTDHECFTAEEATEKLSFGMKILIREGSAAKNFDALIGLMNEHADEMMFCSDDKHPDSLVAGHINSLCARAVAADIGIFKVIKTACINPVLHYKLDVGLLREGDPADFILLKDLEKFEVEKTYINGNLLAENGQSLIKAEPCKPINNFNCIKKAPADFKIKASVKNSAVQQVDVIAALDGQLITKKVTADVPVLNGFLHADIDKDLLKIAVVNRYKPAPIALGFIKNFGLKSGALASSVAHDSHNIVAVGTSDEALCSAINLVITAQGGISCVGDDEILLPLPVAGLMSADDGYQVAKAYTAIDLAAKKLGAELSAPFMTLSFMALLVIPHLKMSDLGLFDGDTFSLINTKN